MKAPKAPANQEQIVYDALLRRLMGLLYLYHGVIRITLLRNIALLTYALLTLFHGARGGNGWLSQAALARCLPLQTSAKGREQRLHRFLANPRLTPEVLIPLHVALVLGIQASGAVPLILDQTTIRGIQTLLVGAVFEGRVLPVAFSCFTYRLIRKSQNILEQSLIVAVMSCFPAESRPLLILDRGYARVALLQKLAQAGIPFLVRAKKNVVVYFQGQPRALSRFPYQPGQIQRHTVFYHSRAKEPLDLIIFRGLGYKETWYLLVPKGFCRNEKEIVDLYAKRMSIEQGFRDWKTHLGVRGLVFRVSDPAPYLTRLLLAFSLSYLICLALGATEEAQKVRAFVEIPRHKPRHQTTRTLSALSIGILRLSLPRFAPKAHEEILILLHILSTGQGLIDYCSAPP
ncbi:MAG TPA: transposase [Thermodesulfobacteriota bacterium]|nr:transposase [Thermodesulfobacteriota bacterium]